MEEPALIYYENDLFAIRVKVRRTTKCDEEPVYPGIVVQFAEYALIPVVRRVITYHCTSVNHTNHRCTNQ